MERNWGGGGKIEERLADVEGKSRRESESEREMMKERECVSE